MSATELWPVLTGLPPLIDECSRVLVLGSFPSKQSLAKQEYYGNAQNHFWQIMAKLFEFDPQAPYRGRTMALIASGVAVWDVICTVASDFALHPLPLVRDRRADEPAEQRMRLERLGLEFGMELAAQVPGMSGHLADLDVDAVRRFSRKPQPMLL